ncbi:MAG: PBP1A family penicillin-binding protein [Vicinamibacteria bacterium]|nr:PBP1A family penicillin-binding protein [Vicinamibacteria bacterium]
MASRTSGAPRRRPVGRMRGLIVRVTRGLWIGLAATTLIVGMATVGVLGYWWVIFGRQIDVRLHGERDRVLPRVYARPLELYKGQALGDHQLVDRLNDLGYAERARVEKPGEFAIGRGTIVLLPRDGTAKGRLVRVNFQQPKPSPTPGVPAAAVLRVSGLEVDAEPVPRVTLDPPLLTALISTGREKRRRVALSAIAPRMVQAVLAIEDRRFYDHPGVDVIRTIGAVITNVRGDRPYLVGGSTITQQLVKNFFLTPEKSLRRKLAEQYMAIILERKASKDEILELYLNEVYLGQRGSFAVHGVAEAARLFFGKDVTNLSLGEAATIAGVIQSPYYWSPFAAPARCRERRNVVLGAMAEEEFVSADAAARASSEPIEVVRRALDAQAPYFVDVVGQSLGEQFPGLSQGANRVEVFTTLDPHLQRLAQDALSDGLTAVDALLAKRKRSGRAQAALIAVDPRTGEVLALVGGRSYNQSQFNRAVAARRQPGSVFKPFVYLAAFEMAAAENRADLTPATLVIDEPTMFLAGGGSAPPDTLAAGALPPTTPGGNESAAGWTPGNYENEYDGAITLRRALALSRNVATIKVAQQAGFNRVAALWDRMGVGTDAHGYPSITLGVFEASPYDIATAYTIFPNGGTLRPLRVLSRVVADGVATVVHDPPTKTIARADTTFLVTNMMRSVINEGTGASARANGFALDAAGKSGTTNDLRDGWFVGFTPELLTVVWVGFDDNQPLGLSGTQAALPIWTTFMGRALAGHLDQPFAVPTGIVYAEIDRDTGQLAGPLCPRLFREAFLSGTEPTTTCDVHR